MRCFGAVGLAAAVTAATAAAPPPVPGDAVFGADRTTLAWSAVSGATSYNVYRGTSPGDYDHACRAVGSTSTSLSIGELPAPGGLFYFLVSAANVDGESALGSDGAGAPIPNAAPCADADGDLVADNVDNCVASANPSQADQDDNGVGDRCDPNTYDFEADPIGGRPTQMTVLGGAASGLRVEDLAGDRAVAYDPADAGVSDAFDRVAAGMPFQDVTVWVDYELSPEVLSLELWSDGAHHWNAGNGAILQLSAAGGLVYYDRHGQSVPSIPGPALPASGRIRIRLVKGTASSSTMHVDAWGAGGWQNDHAVFPIADDHRYDGLGTVMADYLGAKRALRRITVRHTLPAAALTLRKHYGWSDDWKLFQRDASGHAAVPLRFYYALGEPGRIEARVVGATSGVPLPGHDWADHAKPLSPDGAAGTLDVTGVPTGGNYDVESRLVRDADQAVLGQDTLRDVAVGDVFLAGGQSNMSGYSGSLAGAETPVDEVHLFGNDYRWKKAVEPMDDGTDQVDLVSSESPMHTLMLRFAKEIHQATGVPIGVIPGPLGGTNLHTQWQRNEADRDDRGTLYGSLLHRGLVQDFEAPPKGYLWYQGESDAGRGTALYRQDLERLIAQAREDLGNPDLWFGIVQLATYDGSDHTTWIPIQEAQRQVVEADPKAVLAAAVDLPRADVIHLDVNGYKTVGARMAREMLEHAYGQPIDASARLTLARVVGNQRKIELVYDRAVTGGSPGLYRIEDAGGAIGVNAVTAAGNVVTLDLAARVSLPATVTYGYSRSPAAAWVKDTVGTAVAVFEDVPLQ